MEPLKNTGKGKIMHLVLHLLDQGIHIKTKKIMVG